ncbi:hypothetical protein BH11PAT4_BH11PAT4_4530 [soil metagenome]
MHEGETQNRVWMNWGKDWVYAELVRYGFYGSVFTATWRFITVGDVVAQQILAGIGRVKVAFGSSDVGVEINIAEAQRTQGRFVFQAQPLVQIYRHKLAMEEDLIPLEVLVYVERQLKTVSNS